MTLGFLNPRIKTPNLDRLARRGVHFNRAYCPNPTCTPTRASLITGQFPSTHGAFTLGTKLPEHVPTLGDYLRTAGYRSSLIGKAHFQPLRSTDTCESVESYPTLRDLNFWRNFNASRTPWYGFDHIELARNHADEGHVGQHYAIWMEEQGFTDWRAYFQPRTDGVKDTPRDGALAPPIKDGPGAQIPADTHWAIPEEFHYTTWTGQRTIAAIEQAHRDNTPFFIWSSYHDPHPPYCVPEPWASMYDPQDMTVGHIREGEAEKMPPPHRMTQTGGDFAAFNVDGMGNHGYAKHAGISDDDLKIAQATYYGMISFMDHWIGKTLDTLEALDLIDDTFIVFTSDHGHFIGEHGLVAKGPFHYEELVRVPLIASWPAQLPRGTSSEAIQSLVDIPATFAQAAGLGVPLSMQGISQVEAWSESASARDWAIIENHHQSGPEVHLRTLVTDRYKLTVYRGRDWGELFDLEADPEELENRYDDADYATIREQMYRKLVQADLEREPSPTHRVAGA